MNRKCLHFWKLDAIWGSRPNNRPVAIVETLQPPSEPTISVDPSLLIDEIVTGGATGSEPEDGNDSDGVGASRSVTQPLASMPVSDDENDVQVLPTRRSRSKLRGAGRGQFTGRLKGGDGDGLKRLLEGSESRKEARDGKRIKVDEERMKLEADVQMRRIESERATAERVAEIQARSNEQTAEIQTRSNVQMAEVQARSNERMAEMQQETMRMQMQMMEGLFKIIQSRGT